jgi:tetratricopeptide (TPR) repeat protein
MATNMNEQPISYKNYVQGNIVNSNVEIGDKYILPEKPIPIELSKEIPRLRVTDVIGREKILENINSQLFENKTVVLVNGLGGIGKTTVAMAYLSQYRESYYHLVWITQTGDDVRQAFITDTGLVKNLEIEYSNDITKENVKSVDSQNLFEQILSKLKSLNPEKPGLLVIDNADASIRPYERILPGHPNWHVLITSREYIPPYNRIELGFLSIDASYALFQKHCQFIKQPDQIHWLLGNIEYHTLTIEILAKTAQRNRLGFETLKGAIENDVRANIYTQHSGDTTITRVKSYLVSIFDLSGLTQNEYWIMCHFCFLPTSFIGFDTLKDLLKVHELDWKDEFSSTLEDLYEKGWLLKDAEKDSFRIHVIIQEVAFEKLTPELDQVQSLLASVLENLTTKEGDSPANRLPWIDYGEFLLKSIQEKYTLSEKTSSVNPGVILIKSNLALCYFNIGKFIEAKDLLEQVIEDEKGLKLTNPTNHASNLSNLAAVSFELGDIERAIQLGQSALDADINNHGLISDAVANRKSNLSGYFIAKADLQKAQHFASEALETAKRLHSDNRIATNRYEANLANIYDQLGDHRKAIELGENALRNDLLILKPNHPSLARHKQNLATSYEKVGDAGKALNLYEEALTCLRANYDESHQHINRVKFNLAGLKIRLKQFTEAEKLLNEVIESDQKIYGPHSPTLVRDLLELVKLFITTDKLDQAETYIDDIFKILEVDSNKSHKSLLLNAKSTKSSILHSRNQIPQALSLLKESLEEGSQLYPPYHHNIITTKRNIAIMYRRLDDNDSSRQLLEGALRDLRGYYGDSSPSLINIYKDLADIYQGMGLYNQALDSLTKAESILKALEGKDNKSLHIEIKREKGNLFLKIGKFREAYILLKEVLDNYQSVYGNSHTQVAFIQNLLAQTCTEIGKFDEAERYYLSALEYAKKQPNNNGNILRVQGNLANLYRDINKFTKAYQLYEQVLRELQNSNDLETLALTKWNFGRLLRSMSFNHKAIPLYREAITLLNQTNSGSHKVYYVQVSLGHALMEAKNYCEAADCYYKAYQGAVSLYGQNHPTVIMISEEFKSAKSLCR